MPHDHRRRKDELPLMRPSARPRMTRRDMVFTALLILAILAALLWAGHYDALDAARGAL